MKKPKPDEFGIIHHSEKTVSDERGRVLVTSLIAALQEAVSKHGKNLSIVMRCERCGVLTGAVSVRVIESCDVVVGQLWEGL